MASFPASTFRGGRKYVQGWLQVLAGKVACVGGYSALQGRMQCTAGAVALHCRDGCTALQGRLHCTASETGKRDTEIVSPIQDKRKGKKTVAFLTAKFTSKNVM